MAVLGQLARRLGVAESWERDRRCVADLALASLGDAQLVLLRPRRLMNANGRSVARAGELRAPGVGRPAGRAQGPEGIMAAAPIHLQVPVELQLLHGLGYCGSLSFFICEVGLISAPPCGSPELGQRPLDRWAVTRTTISLCQAELFRLTAEEVYLVHDELDKPLGKLALKLGGSAR